ncbi:MAG: N-acetylneuraminate synthase family protein [Dehalococcoidia bacterium]
MNIAKALIRQAQETGWDAVKFQKRTIDAVYTPEFLASPRESPWGTTQRAQKEALEFSIEQMGELFDYARSLGLEPFASAWDFGSLIEVEDLNPKYHKVASPFLTNKDFLYEVANLGKKTFISTGASTMRDIGLAVDLFRRYCCPFTLLHCVSVYPCQEELTNVGMVKTLREVFKCDVGYSGHEVGILPSILAAALGASVIERHICISRADYGSDQSASLERRGMELLAKYCRGIPAAMSDGVKRILPGEAESARKLRYWADVA